MREVHEYFSGLNRGISKKGFRAAQALIKDFYVSKNQIIIKSGDEIFGIYELNRSNERYLYGSNRYRAIRVLLSQYHIYQLFIFYLMIKYLQSKSSQKQRSWLRKPSRLRRDICYEIICTVACVI